MAVVRWVGSVNKGGAVVGQVLCFDHILLLICSSWSCTWFLGRRWGLLVPCALEMYSKASIVVTFPCGLRILAEFGMVAFALCSAISFGVFHIFTAWGWMHEFTFLTYHAVSTRIFFAKITNCVDFSLPLPTFLILRLLSCCYCCFPACWFYLMSFMFVIITL